MVGIVYYYGYNYTASSCFTSTNTTVGIRYLTDNGMPSI
jgi:hypothetical protein